MESIRWWRLAWWKKARTHRQQKTRRYPCRPRTASFGANCKKSEARISDLETELFKLRNQLFSYPMPTKLGDIDKKLMDALRSGGTWANREILQELGVDANDIEGH